MSYYMYICLTYSIVVAFRGSYLQFLAQFLMWLESWRQQYRHFYRWIFRDGVSLEEKTEWHWQLILQQFVYLYYWSLAFRIRIWTLSLRTWYYFWCPISSVLIRKLQLYKSSLSSYQKLPFRSLWRNRNTNWSVKPARLCGTIGRDIFPYQILQSVSVTSLKDAKLRPSESVLFILPATSVALIFLQPEVLSTCSSITIPSISTTSRNDLATSYHAVSSLIHSLHFSVLKISLRAFICHPSSSKRRMSSGHFWK